eukprot:748849-Hanusia_phi.AAC.2
MSTMFHAITLNMDADDGDRRQEKCGDQQAVSPQHVHKGRHKDKSGDVGGSDQQGGLIKTLLLLPRVPAQLDSHLLQQRRHPQLQPVPPEADADPQQGKEEGANFKPLRQDQLCHVVPHVNMLRHHALLQHNLSSHLRLTARCEPLHHLQRLLPPALLEEQSRALAHEQMHEEQAEEGNGSTTGDERPPARAGDDKPGEERRQNTPDHPEAGNQGDHGAAMGCRRDLARHAEEARNACADSDSCDEPGEDQRPWRLSQGEQQREGEVEGEGQQQNRSSAHNIPHLPAYQPPKEHAAEDRCCEEAIEGGRIGWLKLGYHIAQRHNLHCVHSIGQAAGKKHTPLGRGDADLLQDILVVDRLCTVTLLACILHAQPVFFLRHGARSWLVVNLNVSFSKWISSSLPCSCHASSSTLLSSYLLSCPSLLSPLSPTSLSSPLSSLLFHHFSLLSPLSPTSLSSILYLLSPLFSLTHFSLLSSLLSHPLLSPLSSPLSSLFALEQHITRISPIYACKISQLPTILYKYFIDPGFLGNLYNDLAEEICCLYDFLKLF